MSLYVLELIVHNRSDVRRCRHILSEQCWILLESICLNFMDDAATFGDVFLEFTARLKACKPSYKNYHWVGLTCW